MTKTHKPELSDENIVMLITGLDLIARNLGNGQQQGGLGAIAEVAEKSAPVLALAAKLQAYLPKPDPAADPNAPPAAAPKTSPNRQQKRAAAARARK